MPAMMGNMTTLENPTPKNTSKRLRRNFDAAAERPRQRSGTALLPPMSSSRISSTRFAVSQKNRFGEMVVPNTAMSRIKWFFVELDVWDHGVGSTVAQLWWAAGRVVVGSPGDQTGPSARTYRFSPFGLPPTPSDPEVSGWAEPGSTALIKRRPRVEAECHGVRRVRCRKVAMQRIP